MLLARGALAVVVAVLGLAVTRADATDTPTITAGPGDVMTIQGSNIQCAVSTTAPRAVVCGVGSQQSLLPNSYAITVADKGAVLFVATGSQRIIARGINPAISGAPFTGSSHKPTSYVLAKHEHVILAGTHIACAALIVNGVQTFGCGALHSLAGYYIAGAYAATISGHYVGILRVGENGAQTVVARENQP
ncbi:MAG: hypothetical protein ACLP1E_06085 [Acidimicrobiales bacterium]